MTIIPYSILGVITGGNHFSLLILLAVIVFLIIITVLLCHCLNNIPPDHNSIKNQESYGSRRFFSASKPAIPPICHDDTIDSTAKASSASYKIAKRNDE